MTSYNNTLEVVKILQIKYNLSVNYSRENFPVISIKIIEKITENDNLIHNVKISPDVNIREYFNEDYDPQFEVIGLPIEMLSDDEKKSISYTSIGLIINSVNKTDIDNIIFRVLNFHENYPTSPFRII